MSAALFGIDIVGVTENIFLIAVVVLQGNFNHRIFTASVKVNRLVIEFGFLTVEVFDKRFNAAFKVENIFFSFAAFIGKSNFNAAVQESQFAQSVFQSVVIEIGNGENFIVRQKDFVKRFDGFTA